MTQIPNFKARQISSTLSNTAMIDLNNNVWVCGNNKYGQLGLGNIQNKNVLTQITNFKGKQVSCGQQYMIVIDMNNNVWTVGRNSFGKLGLGLGFEPKLVPILTQISNIKARNVRLDIRTLQ